MATNINNLTTPLDLKEQFSDISINLVNGQLSEDINGTNCTVEDILDKIFIETDVPLVLEEKPSENFDELYLDSENNLNINQENDIKKDFDNAKILKKIKEDIDYLKKIFIDTNYYDEYVNINYYNFKLNANSGSTSIINSDTSSVLPSVEKNKLYTSLKILNTIRDKYVTSAGTYGRNSSDDVNSVTFKLINNIFDYDYSDNLNDYEYDKMCMGIFLININNVNISNDLKNETQLKKKIIEQFDSGLNSSDDVKINIASIINSIPVKNRDGDLILNTKDLDKLDYLNKILLDKLSSQSNPFPIKSFVPYIKTSDSNLKSYTIPFPIDTKYYYKTIIEKYKSEVTFSSKISDTKYGYDTNGNIDYDNKDRMNVDLINGTYGSLGINYISNRLGPKMEEALKSSSADTFDDIDGNYIPIISYADNLTNSSWGANKSKIFYLVLYDYGNKKTINIKRVIFNKGVK